MQPKVCIQYGFCEGPKIGRAFESSLKSAGYALTRNMDDADIVVAHSGGCFVIPNNSDRKLMCMIGLPYSPSKPMVVNMIRKIWLDFKNHEEVRSITWWVNKTFWNGVYFFRMPNNMRMLLGMRSRKWQSCKNVVLIRNTEDVMCTVATDKLPFVYAPKIASLAGQHDDCWIHSDKYVDIIKQYYGNGVLAQAGK